MGILPSLCHCPQGSVSGKGHPPCPALAGQRPIKGELKLRTCVQLTGPVHTCTVRGPGPTVQVIRPAPPRLHHRYHGIHPVPTAPWDLTLPTAPAAGFHRRSLPWKASLGPRRTHGLPRLPPDHGHPRPYRPLVFHYTHGTHGPMGSHGTHGDLASYGAYGPVANHGPSGTTAPKAPTDPRFLLR